MTQKELKAWLYKTEPLITKEATEDAINWILEALENTSHTIDVDALREDVVSISLRDILYLVAYGTPDIPLALRKKKIFLHSVDCEEFYFSNDKDYKIFWENYIKDTINPKYLISIS